MLSKPYTPIKEFRFWFPDPGYFKMTLSHSEDQHEEISESKTAGKDTKNRGIGRQLPT
jgi:hypothetical protein